MRKDTVVIEAKWLSVVVIGRNEAHNLERLFTSIFPLSDLIADIIYVDSASTDNSVEIASKYCDYVIKLKDSEFLNASIGAILERNMRLVNDTISRWRYGIKSGIYKLAENN